MTKIRVLFLSPFTEIGGGAERVLLDHIEHLDRARFEPYVAVVGPGSFAEAVRELGVEPWVAVPHSESKPWGMARELWRFGRYVSDQRIQVIVGNKHRSILYWGLSRARQLPFVWLVHDPVPEESAKSRLANLVAARLRPSWTIWVTTLVHDSYLRRFPRIDAKRTTRIFPGTAADGLSFDATPQRARQRFGVPAEAPIVVMFARMQASKGHLDLIAAASEVLRESPETRFLICGGTVPGQPDEHERRVLSSIRERGLEDRVLPLGMIGEQEKRDVLAAATILVHPAQWEPFGIAVIEGMAVGKPVVVADASGPAAIVEDGQTGLVVPRADSGALAAALVSLLRDPNLAAELGGRAAARVRSHFDVGAAARQLENVIEGVC